MKEYKPIILTLVKFFSVYLLLVGIYYLYLIYYNNTLQTCDPYTSWVAKQASALLNSIGFDSKTLHVGQEDFMRFYINNKAVSIVNEGCNAMSVIILYASFTIAFASNWKKTLVFLLITIIILHFSNIARVSFLNYIFYYYPEYKKEAHDYLFPALIYGLIILLWIVWIKFFVFNPKKMKTNEELN